MASTGMLATGHRVRISLQAAQRVAGALTRAVDPEAIRSMTGNSPIYGLGDSWPRALTTAGWALKAVVWAFVGMFVRDANDECDDRSTSCVATTVRHLFDLPSTAKVRSPTLSATMTRSLTIASSAGSI